jgi:hypothetical protein
MGRPIHSVGSGAAWYRRPMSNEDTTGALSARRIGFVGAGNMAGALIRGLLHSKAVAPDQIWASDLKAERLTELSNSFGISTTHDNEAVARATTWW